MNKYRYSMLSPTEKQELWRLKQVNIFYGSGRPIYNIDIYTEHIRSHNNPYFYNDNYSKKLLK